MFARGEYRRAMGKGAEFEADRGGETPPGRPSAPDPATAEVPPRNAEDWTDEQWLSWLRATDDPGPTPTAPPVARRRLSESAGGQILGQAMMGLAQGMYGRNDEEVVVVSDAPGDPPDDEDVTVRLDPEHPEHSTVVVRRRGGHRG